MTTSPDHARWGRDFDPDRLAMLELRMWKAYYRRQAVRLMALLIQANREQARVSWPRAVAAAIVLARAAAGFGRSTGDYDRFLPGIVTLNRSPSAGRMLGGGSGRHARPAGGSCGRVPFVTPRRQAWQVRGPRTIRGS